ncbi:MAG TPA: hypothetical protein VF718_01320 [Allosphingosinicella sp.]
MAAVTARAPVRVTIDRLVLHGVAHADAAAVQRALAAELSFRLAAGGAPTGGFERARFDIAPVADPAALGRQAGAALSRSLMADSASVAGAAAGTPAASARPLPPPAMFSTVAPRVQRSPTHSPEPEGEGAYEEEAGAELESSQAGTGPGSAKRLRRARRKLRRGRRRLARHNKNLLAKQALYELKGKLSGVTLDDLADEAKGIVEASAPADDYDSAYEKLKSNPKMWALHRGNSNADTDTYVYLPSYLASQTINLSLAFDIPIAVADDASSATTSLGYLPLTAAQLLALAGVDAPTQGRVLRAVNSTNATVAVSAQILFVTQSSAVPVAGTPAVVTAVQTLGIRNLNSSDTNILRSVRARRLPASVRNPAGQGSTESFRLVGTLTVTGREERMMILLTVSKGMAKKKAVEENFK